MLKTAPAPVRHYTVRRPAFIANMVPLQKNNVQIQDKGKVNLPNRRNKVKIQLRPADGR
jgi:hypothetical protein